MNKKLQVFVSSTYTDLIEERQAASQAILDAGHIPAGMELFKAGKPQIKTIQRWIDESDVYMLILGGRYGSIEEKSGLGYTEVEYMYALSKKMPVFAIVLNDSFLHTKASKIDKNNVFCPNKHIKKYKKFKANVEQNLVRYANNIDQISSIIHTQLNEIYNDNENNLQGWIKCETNTLLEALLNCTINHDIINNCNGLFDILTRKLNKLLSFESVINQSRRFISIYFLDNNSIEVTISNIKEYYCHSNKFEILFNATKQQAESFEVIKLDINGHNYMQYIKPEHRTIPGNGLFNYQVYSNQIILDSPINTIKYTCKYKTSTNDFFVSQRLHSPCRQFGVTVTLNNTDNKYIALCSLFSSSEKLRHADFTKYEFYSENIYDETFPEWSLPGSGYIVTLKKIE